LTNLWLDPDVYAPGIVATRCTSKGNVVGKALEGVRVLDMTHVQSGASCAQILAWTGADVVKLEAPGGDITRKPLRDIPDVDSFYVTVLRLPPDQTVRLPGRRPPLTLLGDTNEDIEQIPVVRSIP
jgi:hypothetical protein